VALTKVGKEGITGISNSSDATAITIDSSERVGIGITPDTTSNGKSLQINRSVINDDDGGSTHIAQNGYYNSAWKYVEDGTAEKISLVSGTIRFDNASSNSSGADASLSWSERMRIDSSGNVLVGTSVSLDTSGVGCKFKNTGSITGTFNTSSSGTSGFHYYNTNGTNNGYRFYVRADGGVYNYSSANYNLSDEREKKNIADMGSHYEDFKKFKFRDFNYNTEEDSQPKKHGVIAQEVELVNSNLVGEDFKVKVDGDGKDVLRKGLKEEQFVMIGLKTLQETIVKLEGALARIDTLEAKVTALESK
tara:strand:- start:1031 stop:1948 length:918 start_codon:yes stop_codon:yes gene_type:complete